MISLSVVFEIDAFGRFDDNYVVLVVVHCFVIFHQFSLVLNICTDR